MPSFHDTWCIDIVRIVRTGDVLAVYHTTWRMTHDIEAFKTAIERLKHPRPYTPTLVSDRLAIDDGDVKSIFDRLDRIQIPLRSTRNSISLDGVSFELQIGDGCTGAMLQWHNDLPSEWPREFGQIVNELSDMEAEHTAQASEQSGEREPPMMPILRS
jgi:hypothetical protein